MGLFTWTDRFPEDTLASMAAKHASSVGDRTLPAEGVALGVEAIGRVNAGRWIADCPQAGCSGAELVNLEELLFFCCECRNAGVKGQPIKVTVPSHKDQAAIEKALLARPVPKTRNWIPGEPIKHLHAENEEHGL